MTSIMAISQKTFIFCGRSGCGKGTQAEKVKEYFASHESTEPFVVVGTGQMFREFMKGDKYTHALARDIAARGELQPEFLTVGIWSKFLVENVTPDCHLLFDGLPRRFDEAHVLDTALTFYRREKPYVIFMDVDRDVVIKRLLARGREDDNPKDIETRLNWFDDQVMKVVDYYRTHPNYHFIRIDSSQSIDRVFNEILIATGLSKV